MKNEEEEIRDACRGGTPGGRRPGGQLRMTKRDEEDEDKLDTP